MKFTSRYDFNTNSEAVLGSHDDAIFSLEYSPETGEPPHDAITSQYGLWLMSLNGCCCTFRSPHGTSSCVYQAVRLIQPEVFEFQKYCKSVPENEFCKPLLSSD